MHEDELITDLRQRLAQAERRAAACEHDKEAVVESEARLWTLFNAVDEGLAVVEMIHDDAGEIADMVFRQVNRSYERQGGLRNVIGRSVKDVLPGVEDVWLNRYKNVARTGEPIRVEDYQRDVDRWFDVYFSRVDDSGQFIAIVFNDITARKQAEIAVRDSDERRGFLLELGDILQRQARPDELKASAMQLLGRHLGVSRAQYHEVDDTGEFYGADGIGYSDGLPLLDLKYRIGQFGSFVADDFEAGRPFRSDDLSLDPRPSIDERDAFEKYEIRAGAGFPLLRGGKLVAIVAVHDRRPHAWTDLEMELIHETAERVWVAVERARSEIAAEESVEGQRFLLALSDALRAEIGPDAIADRAIRMLSDQLRLDRCYLADYRLEEDRADITHQAGTDRLPPMPATIRLSDFPEAFRTVFDRTLVITDVTADESLSATDKDNILGLEMRALIAPTLRHGPQRPLWVIVAASAGPRHWTKTEIALAEDVAERTWVAVERARGEAALRESEARFRQFAEASAAGLWVRDARTLDMEFLSPAVSAIYGADASALGGDVRHWAAMIVPDDRDGALRHLESARDGATTTHEFRIQRPSDGVFRWLRNTDFPLYDDDRIGRVGGIVEDITETRHLAEHRSVLLAELQHRVRNIMALIRSLANRTAPGASDVEDYRASLEGRLLALSRVQALLTREANAGGSLRSIVDSEIAAQAHHPAQYTLVGPDIMLAPKSVEVLTLAFHELTTNAMKYGALAVPEGRITVRWSLFEQRGGPWLRLEWVEAGAPARPRSARKGFGSELIEGRVPYELRGTGAITIEPEGARCRLEFPLGQAESILETDAPQPTTIFGGTIDMTGAADLTGRRVLVVEDDFYMANDTAAALRGAAAEVLGPCPSEGATFELLRRETPTHAVLDLNLGGGGPQFGLAEMLKKRGIPFLFLTGYDPDVIPAGMADVERLQKPVTFKAIVEAIGRL